MKIRIAVLAGGYSGEHAVSLKSAETIMAHIDRDLYEPTLVVVDREGWTARTADGPQTVGLDDFSIRFEDQRVRFDFAYIIIHGTPGEDGKIQGYLDIMGVPYSSGSALSSALSFDKAMTQTVLRSLGHQVTAHAIVRKGDHLDTDNILQKVGLPCFVKPSQAGSSIGISKVKEKDGLKTAILKAFDIHDTVIIEKGLVGREVTCGVYRTEEGVHALPVTEIIHQGEFFDYAAKYQDERTDEVTPAQIPEEDYLECQRIAKEVYHALECAGFARVDFFLCEDGLHIVEMNTVPGMSAESILPRMLRASETDLNSTLTNIIEERRSTHIKRQAQL